MTHPNLVALHELIGADDRLFFTMDLVEGVDFIAHLRGEASAAFDATVATDDIDPRAAAPPAKSVLVRAPTGNLRGAPGDVGRLRPALRQLAEGVFALHAAGKLHRDLKPSDVLVTPAGRVVILDFGLVSDKTRGAIRRHRRGHDPGHARVHGPEQAGGRRARPGESDWYATSASCLAEALTGAPAVRPGGRCKCSSTSRCTPRRRRAPGVAPDVPEDLDALCSALLQRDPDARPSGEEVLHALPGRQPARASAGCRERRRRASSGRRASCVASSGRASSVGDVRAGSLVLALVHGRIGDREEARSSTASPTSCGCERGGALSGRCYERESVPYKAFDSHRRRA